ncbi:SGNH/GDSL hydrolase family protein [Geodermatophilus sp. SYSU D00079]
MDATARGCGSPRPGGTLRRLGTLTVVLAVGVGGAGVPAASAQGDPVGGAGNHYFLSGAGNTSGVAVEQYWFGDPGDEVYLGDFVRPDGSFGADGRDDAMVRRGNTFTIRGQGGRSFAYGNPGDTVLVGDWDGDGTDTLAVRRGNVFHVKNDVTTGVADSVFAYGDPGDTVLVGNWDGDTSAADALRPVTTDTLMVRRGNHYFVKNSTTTGVADYDFWFGEPGDAVLVGDWATSPAYGVPGESGDHADALAVRRGNAYFLSEEVWTAEARRGGHALRTRSTFHFGNPTDTAFTAQLERTVGADGQPLTLYGDGLGVRRNDVVGGVDRPAPPAPAPAGPPVRTYVAVGDSITAGLGPHDSLGVPGPHGWVRGETAGRLQLAGGWAVPGATAGDMRAHVTRTPADVLVLLAGTNDLLRGIPWEVTADDLRAVAATVGTREVLLVGIVPITEFPAQRALLNSRLAALASDMGWRYVDPWTPVAHGDAWAPWATPDNLHPTPEAAVTAGRIIADRAWQAAAQRSGR